MEVNSTAVANMTASRGKSAQSIGQLAKMVVAQAREAGAELPSSVQGIAASGLARGADMESVLAGLVATDPVDNAVEDPGGSSGIPDLPTPPDSVDAVSDTEGGDALTVPDVEVFALSESATVGSTSPALNAVPAKTSMPLTATASSLANDIARDALEMLFGQTSVDDAS